MIRTFCLLERICIFENEVCVKTLNLGPRGAIAGTQGGGRAPGVCLPNRYGPGEYHSSFWNFDRLRTSACSLTWASVSPPRFQLRFALIVAPRWAESWNWVFSRHLIRKPASHIRCHFPHDLSACLMLIRQVTELCKFSVEWYNEWNHLYNKHRPSFTNFAYYFPKKAGY